MSNFKQALAAQAKQVDPFTQAKQIQFGRESAQALSPVNEDMFSMESANQDIELNKPDIPEVQVASREMSVSNMTSADEISEQIQFRQSDVAQKFAQEGFGDLARGLSFSSLGRVQLIGRLESRFGESWMNNPQAKKLLDAFESQMKKNETKAANSDERMQAQADRTMRALLGGGV